MSRLHSTARWQRRRAAQLREHPLCAICEKLGRVTAATVADHVVPHRGDEASFWEGALQSLCTSCHSSIKQQQEKSGTFGGCDERGMPLDPSHWWRTGGTDEHDEQ